MRKGKRFLAGSVLTPETANVGRPRKYENAAQRKAVYRDRKAAATLPERRVWDKLSRQSQRKGVAMYWSADESGFQAWLRDMGPCPEGMVLGVLCDGYDLARVGFTPGNLAWQTPDERDHYTQVNKRWEQRYRRSFVPRIPHTAPIYREQSQFRRIEPIGTPDTTRTSAQYWNRVLASHGLTVSAGSFLADAPQGCGLPTSGGYDSKQLDIVHGAHERDAHGKRVQTAKVEYDGVRQPKEYVAPEEFNFGYDPDTDEEPETRTKENEEHHVSENETPEEIKS
jgi:hypothetical protein